MYLLRHDCCFLVISKGFHINLWQHAWCLTCLFFHLVALACPKSPVLPFCLPLSLPISFPRMPLPRKDYSPAHQALFCYANDYQLSTCIPLNSNNLPLWIIQWEKWNDDHPTYFFLLKINFITSLIFRLLFSWRDCSQNVKRKKILGNLIWAVLPVLTVEGQMERVRKCKFWAERCQSLCKPLSSLACAAQTKVKSHKEGYTRSNIWFWDIPEYLHAS